MRPPRVWTVIGRDRERALLAQAVDSARGGRAAVLVVTGEPGIGKSVLLADAGSYAADAGLRVVHVRGVQAERDVPHAGLHALLSTLVSDGALASLPGPHREALEIAQGRRDGSAPARLALGGAVLGVLAAAGPVCLLVDDLQWLDPASVDVLTFAARRLEAEPVALLTTLRIPDGGSFAPVEGLPSVRLAGLADATGLLPGLAPAVAEHLRLATGGNPLSMVEIASALTAEQVSGVTALPRLLPASDPEQVYTERLATLSEDARAAARVLALAGSAPRPVVEAAVGTSRRDAGRARAARLGGRRAEGHLASSPRQVRGISGRAGRGAGGAPRARGRLGRDTRRLQRPCSCLAPGRGNRGH